MGLTEREDVFTSVGVHWYRSKCRRFWMVCLYGDRGGHRGEGVFPNVRCVVDDFGNMVPVS